MQRIESYKRSIPRGEVMAFGGEAAIELEAEAADQFLLTELLLSETVDRMIARRLGLPSYRKWRPQYGGVRQGQREPGHWGIDSSSALVALLPRLEAEDNVLVIGAGAQAEACLLAAFGAEVTFADGDLRVVTNLEDRLDGESLSGRFNAYVTSLGEWLPAFTQELDLVVLDAGTISSLSHALRQSLGLGPVRDRRSLPDHHALGRRGRGGPRHPAARWTLRRRHHGAVISHSVMRCAY
jgi:hypothetical protein